MLLKLTAFACKKHRGEGLRFVAVNTDRITYIEDYPPDDDGCQVTAIHFGEEDEDSTNSVGVNETASEICAIMDRQSNPLGKLKN
jgi:hypothetical protein